MRAWVIPDPGAPDLYEALPMRAPRVNRAIWALVTFLSVAVGGYAVFMIATGFEFVPDSIQDNAFFTPLGLRLHIVAAAVALLVGPFQLARSLRDRHPQVHRVMGRIYVVACLLGGVCGGAIALTTSSGLVAGFGFLGLALGWLLCTTMGLRRILQGDVLDHQRWMRRSFALTFAAVTLRVYLGVSLGAGLDFDQAYPAIAWLCWLPNLLVIELWLRRQRRRSVGVSSPAGAVLSTS